jgi:hypothetical protein
MPHEDKMDKLFTDMDLKAFMLKWMPFSWQNTYLLKGTHNSDNFHPILSYFVQFQGITDNPIFQKPYSCNASIYPSFGCGNQYIYLRNDCGQGSYFYFSIQSGWHEIECIPGKANTSTSWGPYVDFHEPYHVHTTLSHK